MALVLAGFVGSLILVRGIFVLTVLGSFTHGSVSAVWCGDLVGGALEGCVNRVPG
ncbi:MAG: hypothetical protein ABJC19_03715 [Gemmatimonadota bacterium]